MSSNQFIAKCFYSSIIIITLLFTIISMLTPGNQIGEYDQSKIINSGIFICDTEGMADCLAKRSTVDTLIGVLLILAILFELIALGWSIAALVFDEKEGITNQKRILFTPLPIFSFIICILFLFVILLFLLKQNGQIEFDINMSVAKGATIGYSFIICCFGFIFAICSILPGLFLTLLKENIT